MNSILRFMYEQLQYRYNIAIKYTLCVFTSEEHRGKKVVTCLLCVLNAPLELYHEIYCTSDKTKWTRGDDRLSCTAKVRTIQFGLWTYAFQRRQSTHAVWQCTMVGVIILQ